MTEPEPVPTPSLDAVLAATWAALVAAVRDRSHPYHLPTLATIGLDGSPEVRTVVLRAVEPALATILCHTDARSPKVAEIAADPRVAWHFYDPATRVQVRVRAVATVHRAADGDPLALARWDASTLSARRCYLAPRTPGADAPGPSANLPEGLLDRSPVAGEDEAGRTNFAVIATRAIAFDRLELHADGHRRARWDLDRGVASWLEP